MLTALAAALAVPATAKEPEPFGDDGASTAVQAAEESLPATADTEGSASLTMSADVVSQYVWRGLELGDASVQPLLGVSWRGLSVGAFGSVGFVNTSDAKEIDIFASYTLGGFSLGVTDYWMDDPVSQYFRYKAHATGHVFEASVAYDFGPLSLSWQTNFAGADGVNGSGHRAYSSYAEVAAPFSWVTCDWQATLGAVPWATDYYGAPRFTVTNISLRATKAIRITEHFSLPLFVQLTANPEARKAYFVAGLTIDAFQ